VPDVSVASDKVPGMSNAAAWAATAGNKFRQAARESTSPTTVLIAEGLTALAEAIRELDLQVENHRREVTSPN
jgi:hypothetical protein